MASSGISDNTDSSTISFEFSSKSKEVGIADDEEVYNETSSIAGSFDQFVLFVIVELVAVVLVLLLLLLLLLLLSPLPMMTLLSQPLILSSRLSMGKAICLGDICVSFGSVLITSELTVASSNELWK